MRSTQLTSSLNKLWKTTIWQLIKVLRTQCKEAQLVLIQASQVNQDSQASQVNQDSQASQVNQDSQTSSNLQTMVVTETMEITKATTTEETTTVVARVQPLMRIIMIEKVIWKKRSMKICKGSQSNPNNELMLQADW